MNTLRRWWNACINWLQSTFSYPPQDCHLDTHRLLLPAADVLVGNQLPSFLPRKVHPSIPIAPAKH